MDVRNVIIGWLKPVIFLCSLLIMASDRVDAQSYPYDAHWAKIEQLEEEGLLKKMLPLVEEIYLQAKKDQLPQHSIKALLYQSKILFINEDDVRQEAELYARFKQEILGAGPIEQRILQSLLAGFLFEYYQSNRYIIDRRTTVDETFIPVDFRTWTETNFIDEIQKLFDESMQPAEILWEERTENWFFLLDTAVQFRELRPTLNDILTHRAVDFYSTSNQPDKSLLLIKTLWDYHLENSNINAYLYNRLEAIKLQHALHADEKILMLKALATEEHEAWMTSEVLLELAATYYTEFGQSETADDRKLYGDLIVVIATQLKNVYPESRAAKALQHQILSSLIGSNLGTLTDTYHAPDQHIPVVLTHKNTENVYVEILEATPFKNANIRTQADLDSVRKILTNVRKYAEKLKYFDDYHSHSTIIKIDPLEPGEYLIILSTTNDFQTDSVNAVVVHPVKISEYAIASRDHFLLLTHRESGRPVAGGEVGIYHDNGDSGPFEWIRNLPADENGLIDLLQNFDPEKQAYRNIRYRVKGDEVFFGGIYYGPRVVTDNQPKAFQNVQFFIDRGIYRPGQTIYFKGIVYQELGESRRVKSGDLVTVQLLDHNQQEIASVELKSNEYGSIFGDFVLPSSGLTGNFSLRAAGNSNHKYFRVEEYKRPTFQVTMDTVKGTFKIDDQVTATGQVQAYSGAVISQAQVSYRVIRVRNYPFPIWRNSSRYIYEQPEQIAMGETTSDRTGRFSIPFVALAGQDSSSDFRYYNYQIEVTVTDINGETQTGQQNIAVGDKSYILSIPLGGEIDLSTFDSIPVYTTNLNGQQVAAQVGIRLTKLKNPQRVLKDFPEVDYPSIDSLTFIKYFPHLPYNNEQQVEHWPREKMMLEQSFHTSVQQKVAMKGIESWDEGTYLLEAYVVDGEDSLWTSKRLHLYRPGSHEAIENEFFRVTLSEPVYQSVDTAHVLFSSVIQDGVALVELEQEGKIVRREQIFINQGVSKFSFPLDSTIRGPISVHYYFGKYNTTRSGIMRIPIVQDADHLTISTRTFRDKLTPGQEETWELTIKGTNQDKVLPEVLALMYDASLDKFAANHLYFPPRTNYFSPSMGTWRTNVAHGYTSGYTLYPTGGRYYYVTGIRTEDLQDFGFSFQNPMRMQRQFLSKENQRGDLLVSSFESVAVLDEIVLAGQNSMGQKSNDEEETTVLDQVPLRRNLQETAFFYPDLRTDEEGNVKIKFNSPESLTEWKFMAFAHTKDLRTGFLEKRATTSKELMVVPNPPRFLRMGDEITLLSKVMNTSSDELSGSARLQLFDAFTMQSLDHAFGLTDPIASFVISEGESADVSWRIKIPNTESPVIYRIVASAGDFSDGEESVLPVLSNRQLVTESISIHAKEGQTKQFVLPNLRNNQSESLAHVNLTLEIASNPIWYAIQALPYLHSAVDPNAEQLFAEFYATMVSKHILDHSPQIKIVFDHWNKNDQIDSRLNLNEELKQLITEETPWVRDADDEETRMKRLALLFDLNNLQQKLRTTLQKLEATQLPSGGFPWFVGGAANQRITTHIVAGFGHMKALGIQIPQDEHAATYEEMIGKAIVYLEKMTKENGQAATDLYYLYARSYFLSEYPLEKEVIKDLLKSKGTRTFNQDLQSKAMLAIVYNRLGERRKAKALVASIKDYAVQSDEMGMYWKENVSGWNWWQSPIETQALLIEAFEEVTPKDIQSVEEMKIWLLKNKQTNHWASTKATTEAIYSLLLTGQNWVTSEPGASLKIGGKAWPMEIGPQATGYQKVSWDKSEITPELAQVEVHKSTPGVLWGALHWQYFEDLDKIGTASNGVELEKSLYLKQYTEGDPVLQPITSETPIQVGDLVTVRLIVRSDRDLQFMHLKDMRASGFEPVNVLSTYKWQEGIGYYESTRDAATNFFFDRIPKGTFVFEYDVRANNAGKFSNGITTLQSMYAPEMNTHSDGIRILITPSKP